MNVEGKRKILFILAYKYRIGLDEEIAMDIKPRALDGILFAVHGRKDFLLLEMVNGTVRLVVDNGLGHLVSEYIPPGGPHTLCDGKWHHIQGKTFLFTKI